MMRTGLTLAALAVGGASAAAGGANGTWVIKYTINSTSHPYNGMVMTRPSGACLPEKDDATQMMMGYKMVCVNDGKHIKRVEYESGGKGKCTGDIKQEAMMETPFSNGGLEFSCEMEFGVTGFLAIGHFKSDQCKFEFAEMCGSPDIYSTGNCMVFNQPVQGMRSMGAGCANSTCHLSYYANSNCTDVVLTTGGEHGVCAPVPQDNDTSCTHMMMMDSRMENMDDGDDKEPMTCRDVKKAFKGAGCCREPNGNFQERSGRLLSGAKADIYAEVKAALLRAKEAGGHAAARQLSRSIAGDLEKYL